MKSKSQAEQLVGSKVLITADNWFFAPDGSSYRAAYGTLVGVFDDKDTLGIKANSGSTNWYVQIGRILIAGCQIHYAVNCDGLTVNLKNSLNWVEQDNSAARGVVKAKEYTTPTKIYDADFEVDN